MKHHAVKKWFLFCVVQSETFWYTHTLAEKKKKSHFSHTESNICQQIACHFSETYPNKKDTVLSLQSVVIGVNMAAVDGYCAVNVFWLQDETNQKG